MSRVGKTAELTAVLATVTVGLSGLGESVVSLKSSEVRQVVCLSAKRMYCAGLRVYKLFFNCQANFIYCAIGRESMWRSQQHQDGSSWRKFVEEQKSVEQKPVTMF